MHPFPLFEKLERCQNILIAGAGGGYDIFCGLPLYFHLLGQGKKVELANLSFSPVEMMEGERLTPTHLQVTQQTEIVGGYFPERFLCEFLSNETGTTVPIHCFAKTGVPQIAEAYQAIVDQHQFDCVVLVDGGTDSLMRGDEFGLGTPQEDICSINAVHQLEIANKFLVCLGFGVDTYHGVNHFQFLEAVAAHTKTGDFLGSMSLVKEMAEVQLYNRACDFVYERMSHHPSIVNSSIQSALAGEYADFHRTRRTEGSVLWISPLMPMYWAFELDAIAKRCLYLDQIQDATSFRELTLKIEAMRHRIEIKGWQNIPV